LAKAWARSLSKNSKEVGAIEPENNAKRNEISDCISVKNNARIPKEGGSIISY